jgi:hypothetical protein
MIDMAKKQVIRLTESDLHNIIKESVKNVLKENANNTISKNVREILNFEYSPAKRNEKYTINDISHLQLGEEGFTGTIYTKSGGMEVVPLRVEINVQNNLINPYDCPWQSYMEDYFNQAEINALEENLGMDINNPPTPGWYEVYAFKNPIMYIEYGDAIYPVCGHSYGEAFYPGGSFYKTPPTKMSDFLRIVAIGEYI